MVGALAADEAACRGDAVDIAADGVGVGAVLRRTGSGDAVAAGRPITGIGRVAASVRRAAGRSGCADPIMRRSGAGVARPDVEALPARARAPTAAPVVVAVVVGSRARRSGAGALARVAASTGGWPATESIGRSVADTGKASGAAAETSAAAPACVADAGAALPAVVEAVADGRAEVLANRCAVCCAGSGAEVCPATVASPDRPALDRPAFGRAALDRAAGRAGSGSTAATARRTAATKRDTAGAGRPGTGAEAPPAACAGIGLDTGEVVVDWAVAARAASPGTAGALAPGPEPFPVEFPAGAPARVAGVRGAFSRARSWFINIGPAAVVASERRTFRTSACRPATMPPGV